MASVDRYFHIQHGLITLEQAKAAGLSRRQVQRLVAKETWRTIRPGIYRNGAVPFRWEARVLASVLGRTAVASHRTGAALLGLEEFREPWPEITIPYGRSRSRLAHVHQTSQWPLRAEITRRGIPCTGVERTLLDCAAVVPLDVVERMAECAIRRELTSWERIARTVENHRACGRNGTSAMQDLLERRGGAEVPRSGFSRRVAQLLAQAGIREPVLEYPVVSASGEHILFLDLAWPDQKKAWELDGLSFHFGRADIERDKEKRNRCKSQGWRIQEITWQMFEQRPDDLIDLAQGFLST